ncbi:MAG: xanthine dehydrogenase family protein subunit M [Alphaproteobacteria bacterium]
MGAYHRPRLLGEALGHLAAGPLTVVAGGTDHYPARVGPHPDEDLLDISGLDELRGIRDAGSHWRIGALTTWTGIAEADLPSVFDGLRAAACEVGGAQIQNRGTVGGNLCNASPAADGIPPLLALDARVELSGPDGVRAMPLAGFVTGNRRTQRRPDQLLTAILVPKPARPAQSAFLKLGARRYLVISIVMASAVLERAADGTVAAARVAVGACSAVAQRLPALEAALVGRPVAPGLGAASIPAHLAPLAPIDDVRGSADYRMDAAMTVVRRVLDRAAVEGRGA